MFLLLENYDLTSYILQCLELNDFFYICLNTINNINISVVSVIFNSVKIYPQLLPLGCWIRSNVFNLY